MGQDIILKSFTQLQAWQEGHRLVLMLYKNTKAFPKDEQFGLTSQLRRAAVSHTSNVAEGFTRHSLKEKRQFYRMGLSSITEIQNQILVARDVGYISQTEFQQLAAQTIVVAKLTNGLIRSVSPQPPAIPPQRDPPPIGGVANPQPPTERGSIFLEVLLTIAVTTVAAVGLILTLLFAIQLGLRAHWETLAGQLGHQALEMVRHTPFDALPTQTDGPLLGNPEPPASDLPQGTATLTIRDYLSQTDISEALVVVTYTEGGRTRTLQFSTLVANGGLND